MSNYANVLMRRTLFQSKKERVIHDIIRDAAKSLDVEPPKVLFYRMTRVKSGRFNLAYHRNGKIYISEELLRQPKYKVSVIILHEFWHYYSKYLHKSGAFSELILTHSQILEEVMADSFSFRSTFLHFKLKGSPKMQKKIIKRSYLGSDK